MNSSTKYIGMDVHKERVSIVVVNSVGRAVMSKKGYCPELTDFRLFKRFAEVALALQNL